MTNLAMITAIIGTRLEISQTTLQSLLTLEGIDPNAEYVADNKCSIYKVALGQLATDGRNGVKSESEGGYSITYDSAGKSAILAKMALDSGCSDLIDEYSQSPSVKGVTPW